MTSLIDQLGLRAVNPQRRFVEIVGGRRLTYAGLFAETARLANVLIDYGVRPGDRVAVQVEKSVEAILLCLACARAGAVFLPLNTAYTLAELEYFIGDAEPALIVCTPDRAEAIASLASAVGNARIASLGDDGATGSLLEQARCAPETFDDVAVADDDLAAILYTSGTTGRSKGAMLTHANLASNALTLKDAWRFSENDTLIHGLPVYHTHGLFVAVNTVLAAGASMLWLPAFNPRHVISCLPYATVYMGVPTHYTRLLAETSLTREMARTMRLFVSGSAPLLAETHREFTVRTGHEILERYGMTETNMITSNPYDGHRAPGSVGPALPGVEVRIADPDSGLTLASGEIGVIEVKGPNVFKGYWRLPEKTAQEFRADGFFITGDLGVMDSAGYVSIVGRGKDLIITGGLNVYPKEVESEIDALDGVVESAVIGCPHPDFGEGVTAVVIARADATLDEAQVIDALRPRLAAFKLPKRVFFETELPRNAMGKVQKARLRERYAALYES
ncbi:MAG TPA: malonyl-CoA synthase [Caulobacteraceae bacterium]|jgi:malonyl-CoA/methylmalonyl-CoA synthetase|nr:malonyl-CoA synthase [Caulobacteraceae bacterium]